MKKIIVDLTKEEQVIINDEIWEFRSSSFPGCVNGVSKQFDKEQNRLVVKKQFESTISQTVDLFKSVNVDVEFINS